MARGFYFIVFPSYWLGLEAKAIVFMASGELKVISKLWIYHLDYLKLSEIVSNFQHS